MPMPAQPLKRPPPLPLLTGPKPAPQLDPHLRLEALKLAEQALDWMLSAMLAVKRPYDGHSPP